MQRIRFKTLSPAQYQVGSTLLRVFDKTWSTIISDYEPEESIQVYETTISSFQRSISIEEPLLSSLQGDNVCLIPVEA